MQIYIYIEKSKNEQMSRADLRLCEKQNDIFINYNIAVPLFLLSYVRKINMINKKYMYIQ